jgi:hypothetical protein
LSFSFSFPSTADDLSGPKSVDDFGGFPNREALELGWLLLPKGEALEVDAPNENAGFDGRAGSASFGAGGLKAEDNDEDDPVVKAPNGDDEATGAGLVSEGAGGGKLKGEELAAALGVKPVPSAGAAELAAADGAGKPAKLDVAEVEVVGLPNENGAAELTGLLAALGTFRVVD